MCLPKYSDYWGLVSILVIQTYLELKQGFKIGENQKPWVFARFRTKGKTDPLVLKGSFTGIRISLVPQLALNQNWIKFFKKIWFRFWLFWGFRVCGWLVDCHCHLLASIYCFWCCLPCLKLLQGPCFMLISSQNFLNL